MACCCGVEGCKPCREVVVNMTIAPWNSWGQFCTVRLTAYFAFLALPACLLTLVGSVTVKDGFETADPMLAMVVAFSIGIPFFSLVSGCIVWFHCYRRKWVEQFLDGKGNKGEEDDLEGVRAALSPVAVPAQPEVASPVFSPKASKGMGDGDLYSPHKPKQKNLNFLPQTSPAGFLVNFSIKNLDHGKLSDDLSETIEESVMQRLAFPLKVDTATASVTLMPSAKKGKLLEPTVEVTARIFLPPPQFGEDPARVMLRVEALKAKITGSQGQTVCEAIEDDLNAIGDIHNAKNQPWNGVEVSPITATIIAKTLEGDKETYSSAEEVGHRRSSMSACSTYLAESAAGWQSMSEAWGSEWDHHMSRTHTTFSEVSRMMSLPMGASSSAMAPSRSMHRELSHSHSAESLSPGRGPSRASPRLEPQEASAPQPAVSKWRQHQAQPAPHSEDQPETAMQDLQPYDVEVLSPAPAVDNQEDLEQGLSPSSSSPSSGSVSPKTRLGKTRKWSPALEGLEEDGHAEQGRSSESRFNFAEASDDARVDNV